jgi:hypothetical protein
MRSRLTHAPVGAPSETSTTGFAMKWFAGALLAIGLISGCASATFDRVRLLVMPSASTGRSSANGGCGLGGSLEDAGRNYFEAPMGAAHGYRVRVFSDDRVETEGRRRGPFGAFAPGAPTRSLSHVEDCLQATVED